MTLANSRLWDAINGFFFLFAHMMEKLYKNSTQLELLREFLNLQKDMIVLMLSMLEGIFFPKITNIDITKFLTVVMFSYRCQRLEM